MPHLSPQDTLPAAVAAALAFFSGSVAAQEAPTTSFEPAAPLRDRDGAALSVPGHAAVRAVDWDQDGDPDLLVGGGDGQVWLLENSPAKGASGMALDPPRAIRAGARERWGTSYTGALLVDVTGDRLPDLLVAHSGNKLTLHPNRGELGAPAFAADGLDVGTTVGLRWNDSQSLAVIRRMDRAVHATDLGVEFLNLKARSARSRREAGAPVELRGPRMESR